VKQFRSQRRALQATSAQAIRAWATPDEANARKKRKKYRRAEGDVVDAEFEVVDEDKKK
jgi:hypothetical protein